MVDSVAAVDLGASAAAVGKAGGLIAPETVMVMCGLFWQRAAWRDTLTIEEILYELSLSLIMFKTMQHEKRCSMMVCTDRKCTRHSRAAQHPAAARDRTGGARLRLHDGSS